RRPARRLLPSPRRGGPPCLRPERRLRHVLLAAPADSGEARSEPLSVPDPGRQRLSQHERAPRAPCRRARGPRRPRPLRLAHLVVARPHGGRRVRVGPDAAAAGLPAVHVLPPPRSPPLPPP